MATRLHNNHLKSKDDGNKKLTTHPPARAMPAESGRGALGGNEINNKRRIAEERYVKFSPSINAT
jgi:hypothetical protein